MYDTAFNGQFPPGAAAYAAYVDGGIGNQPNYDWVVSAFPHARHLSIALFPDRDADALDVETGAAQAPDIPAWYARQRARGITRPVIYASAYTMQASVVPVVRALPGARSSVRLWSAHYGNGEHVCGPSSCRQVPVDMDGTQWTPVAMGRVLDQSLLADDFFGTPPSPTWTENIVQQLPVLKQGANGMAVRRVQGLLVAAGYDLGATGVRKDGIDAAFGTATDKAVRALQAASGIGVDGTVGQQTWAALLGV